MMIIFIVDKLFLAFTIMLFVRILGSWLPELQTQRWMQCIAFYTDPYLNFFRRIIPPLGMIDLSPIIAFLCLGFIENVIKFILYQVVG
jgi:YggT family protein